MPREYLDGHSDSTTNQAKNKFHLSLWLKITPSKEYKYKGNKTIKKTATTWDYLDVLPDRGAIIAFREEQQTYFIQTSIICPANAR